MSALDIGLWDLAGKVAVIDEVQRYAAAGCRYYKMKIHDPDPRVNRRRVEAVKKALGDDVRLMVDVNQRLDILGNIEQARLLEDLDLVWYEEPVTADDLAGCAEVARSVSETLRIGQLAAAHQVAVSPHVVYELSLHVVGALANGFLVEFMDWMPSDLFVSLPPCRDGHIVIPDTPGHGLSLVPGAERKYQLR